MATKEDPPPEPAARTPRKDRLIQTRVPRELEATLKEEAKRRRLSLSHLIRNALEDTFQLVDGMVADMDQIVSDSVHLAKNVHRNARRLAAPGREPAEGETEGDTEEPAEDALSHVYAWNDVVLHRAVSCSSCGAEIGRGQRGFAGLTEQPGRPPAWLCPTCIEGLTADAGSTG